MSARQKPAKGLNSSKALEGVTADVASSAAPSPLPSILDLGRQIVRLSNKQEEMDCAQLALQRQGLTPQEERRQEDELRRLMSLAYNRECGLVDIALGMRARTLGDVAVMLSLAWRAADSEAACQYDEANHEKAMRQIIHAVLTSLDVVIKESGLDFDETVGPHAQHFIDIEHADLGDGL